MRRKNERYNEPVVRGVVAQLRELRHARNLSQKQVFTDTEGGVQYPLIFAMAVISMILPVVLYLVFQRQIISTFASSGIKG